MSPLSAVVSALVLLHTGQAHEIPLFWAENMARLRQFKDLPDGAVIWADMLRRLGRKAPNPADEALALLHERDTVPLTGDGVAFAHAMASILRETLPGHAQRRPAIESISQQLDTSSPTSTPVACSSSCRVTRRRSAPRWCTERERAQPTMNVEDLERYHYPDEERGRLVLRAGDETAARPIVLLHELGGLVFSVLAEEAVAAVVAAQPSLPLRPPFTGRSIRSLGASVRDVKAAARSGKPVVATRYTSDLICPAGRVLQIDETFPGSLTQLPGAGHSTLVYDAHDTARAEVLDLLDAVYGPID